MQFEEGGRASYSVDIRKTELAVIDRSEPGTDHVTVVPASLLEANVGSTARGSNMPSCRSRFRCIRWLPNCASFAAEGRRK